MKYGEVKELKKQSINLERFAARFAQLLSETEENTYTLAEKLSLTPGTISRYQNGLMAPKMTTLHAMANIFGVNPDWLLGAEKAERNAPPARYPIPRVTDEFVTFAVIGEVAAGYDHFAYEDWNGETVDIPTTYLKGRPQSDYFVLSVCGDSMYPLYMEGDKVLILKQKTMDYSGQVGAVLYDNECATLKRVEYVTGEDWMRLIPVNPVYTPKRIEKEDLERCQILGIPKLIIREVDN